MNYQIATRKAMRYRIEFFFGIVINQDTKESVHYAESMSEEYLIQNLNNKIRRLTKDPII